MEYSKTRHRRTSLTVTHVYMQCSSYTHCLLRCLVTTTARIRSKLQLERVHHPDGSCSNPIFHLNVSQQLSVHINWRCKQRADGAIRRCTNSETPLGRHLVNSRPPSVSRAVSPRVLHSAPPLSPFSLSLSLSLSLSHPPTPHTAHPSLHTYCLPLVQPPPPPHLSLCLSRTHLFIHFGTHPSLLPPPPPPTFLLNLPAIVILIPLVRETSSH